MRFFVRLTLALSVAFVAFILLLLVLKVVVAAAVIATLVLAAIYAYNFVRSFGRRAVARRSTGVLNP